MAPAVVTPPPAPKDTKTTLVRRALEFVARKGYLPEGAQENILRTGKEETEKHPLHNTATARVAENGPGLYDKPVEFEGALIGTQIPIPSDDKDPVAKSITALSNQQAPEMLDAVRALYDQIPSTSDNASVNHHKKIDRVVERLNVEGTPVLNPLNAASSGATTADPERLGHYMSLEAANLNEQMQLRRDLESMSAAASSTRVGFSATITTLSSEQLNQITDDRKRLYGYTEKGKKYPGCYDELAKAKDRFGNPRYIETAEGQILREQNLNHQDCEMVYKSGDAQVALRFRAASLSKERQETMQRLAIELKKASEEADTDKSKKQNVDLVFKKIIEFAARENLLEYAKVSNLTLYDLKLEGARMNAMEFNNVVFERCVFRGVHANEVRFTNVKFYEGELTGFVYNQVWDGFEAYGLYLRHQKFIGIRMEGVPVLKSSRYIKDRDNREIANFWMDNQYRDIANWWKIPFMIVSPDTFRAVFGVFGGYRCDLRDVEFGPCELTTFLIKTYEQGKYGLMREKIDGIIIDKYTKFGDAELDKNFQLDTGAKEVTTRERDRIRSYNRRAHNETDTWTYTAANGRSQMECLSPKLNIWIYKEPAQDGDRKYMHFSIYLGDSDPDNGLSKLKMYRGPFKAMPEQIDSLRNFIIDMDHCFRDLRSDLRYWGLQDDFVNRDRNTPGHQIEKALLTFNFPEARGFDLQKKKGFDKGVDYELFEFNRKVVSVIYREVDEKVDENNNVKTRAAELQKMEDDLKAPRAAGVSAPTNEEIIKTKVKLGLIAQAKQRLAHITGCVVSKDNRVSTVTGEAEPYFARRNSTVQIIQREGPLKGTLDLVERLRRSGKLNRPDEVAAGVRELRDGLIAKLKEAEELRANLPSTTMQGLDSVTGFLERSVKEVEVKDKDGKVTGTKQKLVSEYDRTKLGFTLGITTTKFLAHTISTARELFDRNPDATGGDGNNIYFLERLHTMTRYLDGLHEGLCSPYMIFNAHLEMCRMISQELLRKTDPAAKPDSELARALHLAVFDESFAFIKEILLSRAKPEEITQLEVLERYLRCAAASSEALPSPPPGQYYPDFIDRKNLQIQLESLGSFQFIANYSETPNYRDTSSEHANRVFDSIQKVARIQVGGQNEYISGLTIAKPADKVIDLEIVDSVPDPEGKAIKAREYIKEEVLQAQQESVRMLIISRMSLHGLCSETSFEDHVANKLTDDPQAVINTLFGDTGYSALSGAEKAKANTYLTRLIMQSAQGFTRYEQDGWNMDQVVSRVRPHADNLAILSERIQADIEKIESDYVFSTDSGLGKAQLKAIKRAFPGLTEAEQGEKAMKALEKAKENALIKIRETQARMEEKINEVRLEISAAYARDEFCEKFNARIFAAAAARDCGGGSAAQILANWVGELQLKPGSKKMGRFASKGSAVKWQ
jgi:uncharacterized protein YjbI with pentapeptide repeats